MMSLGQEQKDAKLPRGGFSIDIASKEAAQLLGNIQSLLEKRPEPPCHPEKCERMRQLQERIEALEKHWILRLANLPASEIRTRSMHHYYGLCAGTKLEYCLLPTLSSFDRLARTLGIMIEIRAVSPEEGEQVVAEAYQRILKFCQDLEGDTETDHPDAFLRGHE